MNSAHLKCIENPFGHVPLMELVDDRHLAKSNTIITKLAEGSRLIPAELCQRAKITK